MATIDEVRREINRLTDLLIKKSKEYDAREAEVIAQHTRGKQNFSGDIYTVKKNDLLLQDLSGASKTIAAILTAHAAVLAAEVTWHESTLSNRVAPAARRATGGGPANVTVHGTGPATAAGGGVANSGYMPGATPYGVRERLRGE